MHASFSSVQQRQEPINQLIIPARDFTACKTGLKYTERTYIQNFALVDSMQKNRPRLFDFYHSLLCEEKWFHDVVFTIHLYNSIVAQTIFLFFSFLMNHHRFTEMNTRIVEENQFLSPQPYCYHP